MPMTRKTRIWLIVLAIPVFLVVAAVIALKVMFTSERLKSMVIPRIEAATGRTVAVREISLSVLPSIALTLEGVSVSNRPGFSATPFLELDALRLNTRLWPLLKSRLEVTSLDLDGLRVLIEVRPPGETNYADLGGAGITTEPSVDTARAQDGEAPSFALQVPELRLRNGSIEYLDYGDSSAMRVKGLNVDMSIEGDPSVVTVSGDVAAGEVSYGTLRVPSIEGLRLGLKHRMRYDRAKDVLTIERGDIKIQEMPLQLSGTVSNMQSAPTLDLIIGSENLDIVDLLSLVPKDYLKKAEGLKGTGTARVRVAVTGTLSDSTTPDITGTIAARGATLRYPQLPKPITDITLLSNFARTQTRQEFIVEDLTANVGGAPVRMSMTVRNFDDPYLSLKANGTLNLSTLPEYYPLEKGTELAGQAALDVRVAGKVSAPKAMQASGTMQFRDVSVATAAAPRPVRQLNGTLTFSNDVVETKKLSMVVGSSDLALSGTVRNYLSLVSKTANAPRASATMSLRSNRLLTDDIMTEKAAPRAEGPKQAPVEGAKPGSMEGKSKLPLPDLVMDVDASIGTLVADKFEFTNVRGDMHVADGRVTMRNLSLNAFGGSVVSNGSLDLANPDRPVFDLTLALNSLAAGKVLPHFTSFGKYLNGAFSMKTALKGTLNDTLGIVPEMLSGGGRVEIQDGSMQGVKVNQNLASLLSLPDLETIRFKDWGNDFTVQNGRLQIKDLTIRALDAEYVVNGSQGLDGTLEYRMALYLPESAAQKLKIPGVPADVMSVLKDDKGRVKLDLTIGGTMESPKVQLDTDAVQKRAEGLAKQRIDEEKKKLEEKAVDALKKLFKK